MTGQTSHNANACASTWDFPARWQPNSWSGKSSRFVGTACWKACMHLNMYRASGANHLRFACSKEASDRNPKPVGGVGACPKRALTLNTPHARPRSSHPIYIPKRISPGSLPDIRWMSLFLKQAVRRFSSLRETCNPFAC